MAFSSNVSSHLSLHLSRKIGIPIRDNIGKYLSIFMETTQRKSHTFQPIIDRISNRVLTWKEKYLSFTGKEVLVKAITQALPIYSMSTFLLPKKVAHTLEKLIAKYWWSSSNDKRTHWLNWAKLSKPKELRGLGFKDIRLFNINLLTKQGWFLLKDQGSLMSTFMKGKYFSDSYFLEADLGGRPSWL
ncbi:hypothetical protein Scep_020341 [Stephania cephalantha]|uniref:Uncharacterized protein n=1 Tax=Stephania cephalantha TaxID=152367 RepID=A0AAP0NMC5_9MAGN